MTIVLFGIWVVILLKLLAVAAIQPLRSRYSRFELERRKGNPTAEIDTKRDAFYVDIVSLQRVIQAVLLVLLSLVSVATFGWLIGAFVAIIISLEYSKLASTNVLRSVVAKYYDRFEHRLLSFVETHQAFIKWLRSIVPVAEQLRIYSREELHHLVDEAEGVISKDEKKLIIAGLQFDTRLVREVMTPRSVIDTIKRSEVLGPLVLDDLHKTGHSRFPVVDQDIDHIVGVLYVRDVLTLDTSGKHTSKVETAMSKKVFYIRDDHTLNQALSAFLSTHHHLFIVINEFRETVGILTLEDTLEALLGRKIIDEFDAHDDMRVVAARNAVNNSAPNRTSDSKDV